MAKVIIALMACVVFLLFPNIINEFLKEATIDSKYNHYLNNNAGMGIIRCFIISILPLVLSIIYYAKRKKSGLDINKEEGLLINMLIINSALYLMGLYMQYWARLAFYTSFAPIVLMPKLIESVFSKKDRKWVKIIAYICYFIFFVYNIYVNITYGAIADFRVEWW